MSSKKSIIQLTDLCSFKDYKQIWNTHLNKKKSEGSIWKSIANGYLHNDKNLINKNTFISHIDLFPEVTKEIINNYLKYEDIYDEYDLKINIFSTMLPRHYYNFPHKIELYANDSYQYYQPNIFLYHEEFLSDYNSFLKQIIRENLENKKITISRYTFLTWGTSDTERLFRTSALFTNNNIFSFEEFLEDFHLIADRFIPIKNLLQQKYINTCKSICGLSMKDLKNYLKHSAENFDTKKIRTFIYEDKLPINNIVCNFISELHSKDQCFIILVSDLINDFPQIEEYKELRFLIEQKSINQRCCEIEKIEKINPDFINFQLLKNGNIDSQIFLTAEVNLNSQTTTLKVLAEGDDFNKYKDKFDELDKLKIKLKSEIGESLLVKEIINEQCNQILEKVDDNFQQASLIHRNSEKISKYREIATLFSYKFLEEKKKNNQITDKILLRIVYDLLFNYTSEISQFLSKSNPEELRKEVYLKDLISKESSLLFKILYYEDILNNIEDKMFKEKLNYALIKNLIQNHLNNGNYHKCEKYRLLAALDKRKEVILTECKNHMSNLNTIEEFIGKNFNRLINDGH